MDDKRADRGLPSWLIGKSETDETAWLIPGLVSKPKEAAWVRSYLSSELQRAETSRAIFTLATGTGKTVAPFGPVDGQQRLTSILGMSDRNGVEVIRDAHKPASLIELVTSITEYMQTEKFPRSKLPHESPESSTDSALPDVTSPQLTHESLAGLGDEKERSGAGRQSDERKRKAIELHAEDWAVAHYKDMGWTVERIGKPYDLRCTKGDEERHVEVKGATGAGVSIELTINEVKHARNPKNAIDLFVVSGIQVDESDGEYATSGGIARTITNWVPADKDLRPTRFEYRIPST
ncbi:DUF3883 domain-containing protein [Streptomyces samsunensis]|uniref:protein NO VEIN domain-containing protein n=1 Tax=Streptomyces malaysiensis TaxID=92644 RepID=UPI001583D811|nr:DUF3883 domain-containing protein [Streptomyces samsunensis]NUH35286.1 DUF3883 domain-containing protein [Streptomyces samsunensis]